MTKYNDYTNSIEDLGFEPKNNNFGVPEGSILNPFSISHLDK